MKVNRTEENIKMRPLDHARLCGASLLAVACLTGPAAAAQAAERFTADLSPVNAEALGLSASGIATFAIEDGQLAIEVDADGLAPGIAHIQHTHGFPDGQDATCPTAQADTNGDGFVDLMEAMAAAGTTMVPFHGELPSLAIPSKTYPVANEEGATHYRQTVAVGDLEQALEQKFGAGELALDSRVVLVHGVPADTDLPATVQSLPDVPAQVTLPVACGVIKPAE
jgi:hypothetical protein